MKELFQLLHCHQLSPNGYYILYSIRQKTSLEIKIPYGAELTKLKYMEFVDQKSNLTTKAILLLNEIDKIFNKKVKIAKGELNPEFLKNIQIYRELFPKGIKNNRVFRSGVTDLIPKFIWFFKTYPNYTWEQILNCTEKYIDSFGKDITYCKSAAYFIKKEDVNKNVTSELANWCENIADVDDSPPGDFGGFYNAI